MIEYLILLLAIPLGMVFSKTFAHEKEIYNRKQYFPTIIFISGIGAAIAFFNDKILFLTFTFIFLMTLSWKYL